MAVGTRIQNAVDNATGLHYVNAATHGHALALNLHGHFRALALEGSDDPLLYAYQCLDVLPSIAAQVIELEKWCVAVRDATPEQLEESGAQLCR